MKTIGWLGLNIVMNNCLFIVLLSTFFFIVLFWKHIITYFLEAMHACHENQDSASSCSKHSYKNEESSMVIKNDDTSRKAPSCSMMGDNFGLPFLQRIGYFLASNDEQEFVICRPTSLQDTDPKDLA